MTDLFDEFSFKCTHYSSPQYMSYFTPLGSLLLRRRIQHIDGPHLRDGILNREARWTLVDDSIAKILDHQHVLVDRFDLDLFVLVLFCSRRAFPVPNIGWHGGVGSVGHVGFFHADRAMRAANPVGLR